MFLCVVFFAISTNLLAVHPAQGFLVGDRVGSKQVLPEKNDDGFSSLVFPRSRDIDWWRGKDRSRSLVMHSQRDTENEIADGDVCDVPSENANNNPTQPIIDITPFLTGTNNQNKCSDIAYFYLRDTLGLSEETMWKITLEAGSLLGMTPQNLDKKISLLRRTMNLSDEDIRVILGKQPAVLHYSAERNLAPTILFLVRALDLSKGELRGMIMECPSILGYSLENLKKKISFFLHSLGFDNESTGSGIDGVRELLVKTPKLLYAAVDTGLMPRMKFLLKEINFSLEELRLVFQKNPKMLLYSLKDNLQEKIVFFFILQLNMEPRHVRKLLLSYPQVMDYSLENHLIPIAHYFMTELEFSAVELRSIVLKFPRLFTHSLFKIKHVTGFLRYELQLDAVQVKRVVFQAPQVLGLDAEGNLKEKIEFLRKRLDLTEDELGLVLSKMPTLLGLSVKSNLLPKLEYLEDALLSQQKKNALNNTNIVKDTVLKQPTLLGYSLQSRIQPRMEQLIEAGISPEKITVGISMSEDKFQEWLSSSSSKKMARDVATEWNSTAMGFLYGKLNFGEEDVQWICSKLPPEYSSWSVQSLRLHLPYLQNMLKVSDDEMKDIILSHPLILDVSPHAGAKQRLNKLKLVGLPLIENIHTIDYPKRDFDHFIQPLMARIENASKSEIGFLRENLQLSDDEASSLSFEVPSLENTTFRKSLRDKIDYFMIEFNDSTKHVKDAILECPKLLDLSLRRIIKPRMEKLHVAKLSDPRDIARLLTIPENEFQERLSRMAYMTMEKEFPKTTMLMKSSLQLDNDEVGSLLSQLPYKSVACYNIENVINFLLLHGSIERVKAAVLGQPRMLSFTLEYLEDRTKKRRDLLQAIDDWSLDLFSLATMTNTEFKIYISSRNAGTMLQKELRLTKSQFDYVMSKGRRLKSISTLKKRLSLISSFLKGKKNDVKAAIIANPNLLFCSVEKLRKMSDHRVVTLGESYGKSTADKLALLSMTNREYAKLLYSNAAGNIIRDMLDISQDDVDFVLSRSNNLGIKNPEEFLMPKLNYLLGEISKADLRKCLKENPKLFDYSLRKRIMPRIRLLRLLGMSPAQISSVILLTDNEIHRRTELQTFLDLTHTELDSILPMKTWLEQRHLRQSLGMTMAYLLPKFNNSTEHLKQALLAEPTLLTLSLKKQIQPRFDLLIELGHPPSEISSIIELSPMKIEEMKLKVSFCKSFGFTPTETDQLFADINPHISLVMLRRKADYLFQKVFNGSKNRLKSTLIKDPSLLKITLDRMQARIDALDFLKSVGLEYTPSDVVCFIAQSKYKFTREMAPEMRNWYPAVGETTLDGDIDDADSMRDGVATKDNILSLIKDLMPAEDLVYSDDSNRDLARIVHWK